MMAADTMMVRLLRALLCAARGALGAVPRHPAVFAGATLATIAASMLLPPLVLSIARKPVDYFTFNPWLKRLPDYLAADIPWGEKLGKLWQLALFWFSADSPFGGTEWGFAVDVRDLTRILVTSALIGAYFALWAECSRLAAWPGSRAQAGRRGGVAGAFVSVLGLSTGPCSVMGCGAPVLPVVGLAFVGLSSGTLALLASVSTVAGTLVPLALLFGVGYLGWLVSRPTAR